MHQNKLEILTFARPFTPFREEIMENMKFDKQMFHDALANLGFGASLSKYKQGEMIDFFMNSYQKEIEWRLSDSCRLGQKVTEWTTDTDWQLMRKM